MTNNCPKSLQELSERVDSLYWKLGQGILLDTWELRDKDSCSLDVHIEGTDVLLFTIQTYSYLYQEYDFPRTYFKQNEPIKIKWDGVAAACSPFYLNQTFTLPKFTGITEEDIVNCARYFVCKILHKYMIFNISLQEQEQE